MTGLGHNFSAGETSADDLGPGKGKNDLDRAVLPPHRPSEAALITSMARVETVCVGGVGGYATVLVQLGNTFPGPGGVVNLEIRCSFPCRDGVLYIGQELPVAVETRLREGPEAGFELFLRHLLAKKLENAFISQGRYSYAHISRPLGSQGASYYYEWEYGEARCPIALLQNPQPSDRCRGLDDWYEFVESFREAGIDMQSRVRPIESARNPGQWVAKRIIVLQPCNPEREPDYLSRMWMRVNFHPDSIPMDLEKLERYLQSGAERLGPHLTPTRYVMMALAVRYLLGKLSPSELPRLYAEIHAYRVSALRHLNYRGVDRQGGSESEDVSLRE